MFNPKQYRDKAAEYSDRGKTASGSNERRELKQLEKSFTVLADNEQWLSDNHLKTVQPLGAERPEALAEQEEHVLRCLGAALIMQWNTLPTKQPRALFDTAGSTGAILTNASLR